MSKTGKYKSGTVTISVDYGYDAHRIEFSKRTYNRIHSGKPVTVKGQKFHWDGRPDQDYWEFNQDSPGSLSVYTADGGAIYEGTLSDDKVWTTPENLSKQIDDHAWQIEHERQNEKTSAEKECLVGDKPCDQPTTPPPREEKAKKIIPDDALFVCEYYTRYSIAEHFESVYFRRVKGKDELWLSIAGYGYGINRCEFSIEKQHDEYNACLNLLEKRFRQWFLGSPTEFLEPGIINENDYNTILKKIETEVAENIRKAKENITEIIEAAKALGLYTRPGGDHPDYWLSTCPGTNHSLIIRASGNDFYCGYCRRKGGISELRAFVKERKASR